MAVQRLSFFYPNWTRVVRFCEPHFHCYMRPPFSSGSGPYIGFHINQRHNQEGYQQYYGPAVKPNLPPPWRPKDRLSSQSAEVELTKGDSTNSSGQNNTPSEKLQSQDTKREAADTSLSAPFDNQTVTESKKGDSLVDSGPQEVHSTESDGAEDTSASAALPRGTGKEKPQVHLYPNQGAFDDAIHMPSPSSYLTPPGPATFGNKHLHLTPDSNVYHFDTYSLFHDISTGGFTNDQAATIMKAIRDILQKNIDLANHCLTSKSDVENESYLFKTAYSELQSFFQTARNSELRRQHASRVQLQQESDVLSQRLNQELAGMKDVIKCMFNNHNMTTREQQRSIDTLVQDLNYKITLSLNSDGNRKVEGIRWILTSRAALTVATCACKPIILPPRTYESSSLCRSPFSHDHRLPQVLFCPCGRRFRNHAYAPRGPGGTGKKVEASLKKSALRQGNLYIPTSCVLLNPRYYWPNTGFYPLSVPRIPMKCY